MNCPLSRNKKTPVRSVEKYFYDKVTLQKIKTYKLKHKDLKRTNAIDIVGSNFSTQSSFNTHSLAMKNIKGLKLKFTQPSRTSHLAIQLAWIRTRNNPIHWVAIVDSIPFYRAQPGQLMKFARRHVVQNLRRWGYIYIYNNNNNKKKKKNIIYIYIVYIYTWNWRLTWYIIMEVWKIMFLSNWWFVGSMLIFQGVYLYSMEQEETPTATLNLPK